MFQNETNPKPVAQAVWKWRPDENQGVMENKAKSSDFCILAVFNLDKIGSIAYTWQYF